MLCTEHFKCLQKSQTKCFVTHYLVFLIFPISLCLPFYLLSFFTLSLSLSIYASLLQEGQVLECSLINSIRVGAVPKVRPQEKQFPLSSPNIEFLAPTVTDLWKTGETATSETLFMLKLAEALVVYSIDPVTDVGLSLKFSQPSFSLKN